MLFSATRSGLRASFTCAALLALTAVALAGDAAPDPAPWQAVRGQAKTIPFTGTSGSLLLCGTHSFALAAAEDGRVPVGGGFWHDDPAAGRILVFTHDGMLGQAGPLLDNAVAWCSPKVARAMLSEGDAWPAAKSRTRPQAVTEAAQLDGKSCVVLQGAARLRDPVWRKALDAHLAKGGGVLVMATTWALSAEDLAALQDFLAPCGLQAGEPSGDNEKPFSLRQAPHRLLNIPAACAWLAAPPTGANPADLGVAVRTAEGALSLPRRPAAVQKLLAARQKERGWLRPAPGQPWKMGAAPMDDLLLAAQMHDLRQLPPGQLFAHPGAADFPGLCAPGAPVRRTLQFTACSPAAESYVNESGQGTWIETGLYAAPGAKVRVSLPPALAGKGLKLMIGVHSDNLWRSDNAREELLRFPEVTRVFTLEQAENTVGTPFGGLIRFYADPGANLGAVQAVVDGALEAPVFELGRTTPEGWRREQAKPGAWGCLKTPRLTVYVPRAALVTVADPAPLARHWEEVMHLGDQWLGYAKWRQRPETVVQDVQVSVGLHHSGYPLMLGPDGEGELTLRPALLTQGDWGVYHELGHGYQSCFHDEYTLATHAEVDVNLLPGLVHFFLHGRTAWDGPTHDTYDGPAREQAMKEFLALPEKGRTWDKACESAAAYDFHFGLAEAFGWQVWQKALGRLMAFDQKTADPALAALTEGDEAQIRRDRLFLCLCSASERNLASWFERYGLGKGAFPLGAKARAAAARWPAWSGNQPVTAIVGPLHIKAAKPGVIARYQASDPDPGQVFEWSLPEGDAGGLLTIGKRDGELRLTKPLAGTRKVKVRVEDCGVPRTGKVVEVEVGG